MTATATAVQSNNSVLQNYLNQQAQAASQPAPASSTTSSGAASPTSATGMWGNFTTFLNILTTQLQHQDPTNATDPNQFTEELVQFAGVEQQINTNSQLTTLTKSQNAASLATGAGYIGNYVEAVSPSDQISVQNGTTEFNYSLAGAAPNVSIAITNSAGKPVATLTGAPGVSGVNYVTWDGKDASGNQLPDGTYTIAVTAADQSGTAVAVNSVGAITKVTSVATNTDGTLELTGGDLGVSSGDVTYLYTPTTLPLSISLTAKPANSNTNTNS